ncbi:MAG: hypothetical protein GHCLOJNM_03311 [bacterium]|nr:hypothetical protein [bacterium]
MGWFSFKTDGGVAKEDRWLEGKESQAHTHNDGTHGTDVEAFRNTYAKGERVHSEKAKDYGKIHTRK